MKKVMMLSLAAALLVLMGCSREKEEAPVSGGKTAVSGGAVAPSGVVANESFSVRLGHLTEYSRGPVVDAQTYLERISALVQESRGTAAFSVGDLNGLHHLVARMIPLAAAGLSFPADGLLRLSAGPWSEDHAVFIALALRAQGYRKGALSMASSWPEALESAEAWRVWAQGLAQQPGAEGQMYLQLKNVFAALSWVDGQSGSERWLLSCAGAGNIPCLETLGGGLL